jgi:hypothetical protein
VPDESFQRPIEPLSEQSPQTSQPQATPEPAQYDTSGLKSQLDQQRAYAEQQARHRWYGQLEHYLASVPGMTGPKLNYLTAYFATYPERLNGEHWSAIAAAHRIALQHAADDTDEYFRVVNAVLHQQPPQTQPAPAPAPPMPPPMPPAHIDIERTEHTDEPEAASVAVSAPVSRGEASHAMSGEPQPLSPSQVKLSAEQREVARLSMPHLSHDEAEKTYAAGLLKQEKMKRAGLIK